MGVTLHAAVETYHEATEHTRAHWWGDVPEVHFGKDYALSANLAECGSKERWPEDSDENYGGDVWGQEWVTKEEFIRAVELCEEPSEVARGVVAMIACFSRPVRLLFWRK